MMSQLARWGARCVAGCVIGCVILAPAASAAPSKTSSVVPAVAPPTIEQVLGELGFSSKDARRLHGGEIITRDLKGRGDKEIGVVVAMLVPKPLADVAAAIRAGDAMRVNPSLRSYHEIDPDADPDAAFDAVSLTGKEYEEISNLLNAKAGSDLNLSADEIARLQALRKQHTARNAAREPATQSAVNEELRRVLRARYDSYRGAGLRGIASYDRGKGKRVEPGKELEILMKSAVVASKRA